jgi:hypothetical protein
MEFCNDKNSFFSYYPVTGDILLVPGITEAEAKILEENGISNTFNLFGKYMSFKGIDTSIRAHHDLFLDWLKSTNIPADTCMTIMTAIAEKCSTMIPGLYDPSIYAE